MVTKQLPRALIRKLQPLMQSNLATVKSSQVQKAAVLFLVKGLQSGVVSHTIVRRMAGKLGLWGRDIGTLQPH